MAVTFGARGRAVVYSTLTPHTARWEEEGQLTGPFVPAAPQRTEGRRGRGSVAGFRPRKKWIPGKK